MAATGRLRALEKKWRSEAKQWDDCGGNPSASNLARSFADELAAPIAELGQEVGAADWSEWFETWAKSRGMTMQLTADGRFLCPDTALAQSAHEAGCMVSHMYYMELCRQEELAKSAPAGSGEVDGLADTLVRMADNAYCDCIRKMRRPECLGWEEKVRRGSFDSENLRAHVDAGELLGRHRALHEAAALLRKLQQGAE